ncbi:hypothetical protein MHZ92_04650 [Sporosarcina sp. ACRSL]|uniref:hypothetical protein n=1 Tax=Sporosarcina sp. ACRSL TaxID=2918215 RepID=UPI001EF53ABE|nr:hypothetical protein [Sporosarcina sp. ACRSL]MCG7343408.1 hypothetical protein [Sporosarcina sp. ACRSL]
MKSISSYVFHIVLLLIPFIYGFLANKMMFPLFPFIMQLIFLVFWFYVGIRFARLNIPVWKSFMLGNSIWFMSFILFIWQFIILDSASRSMELASLSQHYMLAFVSGPLLIFPFISSGTTIIFGAYILMFITFTIGFWVTKRRNYGVTAAPERSLG